MNNKHLKNFDKALSKLTQKDIEEYAIKRIQATEAGKQLVNLENLLFTFTQSEDIEGLSNTYKGYEAQVIETYLKYNNMRDYGCWQTRAVIDIRTGFLAGEGLSAVAKKLKTNKWINKFLEKNGLKGECFFRAVKGSEMTGKILFTLDYNIKDKYVKVIRIPYGGLSLEDGTANMNTGVHYEVLLARDYDFRNIKNIIKVDGEDKKPLPYINFVYIVTGGDDTSINETNTKIGTCLTEIENYDRGLKELRRSNYTVNRITPDFECKDRQESVDTKNSVENGKWKQGHARIGTSKFTYKVPSSSAHQNVETELQANAKVIQSVTGIPVHWIGHTELMSNRATAQTLYEIIDNATKMERTIISQGIKDLIVKAMEIEIDNGGELTEIDEEFEIRIPLISFHQFKDNIQALSSAYADKAISIDDYRNFIPGIDPYTTKKAIEAEEKKNKDSFKTPNEELEQNIKNGLEQDEELQSLCGEKEKIQSLCGEDKNKK